MLYYWLLFFFVVFVAKLILATVMIYCLLPNDRLCTRCEEETLLMRKRGLGSLVFLGRVQHRWCPRCGWEGLARRGSDPATRTDARVDADAPTRR
jgi:hypothetical protein